MEYPGTHQPHPYNEKGEEIEQTALKTYQEVELAARETYEEIEQAALKKYQEVKMGELKTFEEKQTAQERYQEIERAVQKMYQKVEHAALKKYQEQEVEIKKNENDRGEEMETIKVVKKVVNGQETTTSWDGETTLEEALRNKYGFQGKLYLEVFSVNEASSRAAGWHPEDTNFSSICDGWEKFIKDGGKIESTETSKMVSVEDLIFPPV